MPTPPPSIPPGGALKAVCEAIWEIEAELGLFERQVRGTYFWRLARWETCRVLAERIEGLLAPGKPAPLPGPGRLGHEVAALKKRFASASWREAGPVDTVVVPFPRKHLRNGVPIDIHTQAVLDELAFGKVLVLERTDARLHIASSDRVFVTGRDRYRQEAVVRALAATPSYSAAAAPLVRELEAALQRRLGLAFPLSVESLALRTALFAANREIFRGRLLRARPNRFFAAWQDQAMFAAARDLGIETVEIQHAAISIYNPHYHFPAGGEAPYFADRFLVFAPYWMECVTLPANTRASVVGSTNMTDLRARAGARHARRLIAPSQGPTYWPLFDAVLECARQAPDWEFIFRPHPREKLDDYRSRLSSREAPANLRLSPPDEDLYDLIATAEVQVGLASTALFEGMSMGCRTIVFQSPIVAAMGSVLARGDAVLATNAAEILQGLDTAPAARAPEQYYAPPVPVLDALRS
jgi:hypothetical protein